jgi:hypothetical protein
MSYLGEATYEERERSWRERAAGLPAGPERDTCTALADGYAHLVELIKRANNGREHARSE